MSSNQKYNSITLWVAATVILMLVSAVVCVMLYVLYLRLDYSFDIGPKFSSFDDQLGWTLNPNSSSFIKGSSILENKEYFNSTVYTERNGFRSSSDRRAAPTGAILTIGDSWTFGYCVDYEETYPYFLERELGTPVVNLGVPAYGNGSTFGLLERHVGVLKPQVVVYLTIGLWNRSSHVFNTSLEKEKFKQSILIPSFFHDFQQDETGLAFPYPGIVSKSVSNGVYPGGSLTAGYNLWSYLWNVKFMQLSTYISDKIFALFESKEKNTQNLSSEENQTATFDKGIQHIFEYELNLYQELARKYNFSFVLVEGEHGHSYAKAVTKINARSNDKKILYIGPEEFDREVYLRAEELNFSDSQKYVPKDGHFGPGINRLIGELVARKLKGAE